MIFFFFFMFTSSTGALQRREARNTCVLCPVITLIIPTMGYYTRRGREIRSNLTCREIQLEPKTNRGGGAVPCKIQSVEKNSYDCPLRSAACRYKRRRRRILAWEVESFVLFRRVCLFWWLLVCIQTCDSVGEGGGVFWSLKPALPKDAKLADSEQMLTNIRHKHTEGTLCALISVSTRVSVRRRFRFFSPFFCMNSRRQQVLSCDQVERAATGIAWLGGSTQKSDKAKLLFIRQLHRRPWCDRRVDHQLSPPLFPLSMIPSV